MVSNRLGLGVEVEVEVRSRLKSCRACLKVVLKEINITIDNSTTLYIPFILGWRSTDVAFDSKLFPSELESEVTSESKA